MRSHRAWIRLGQEGMEHFEEHISFVTFLLFKGTCSSLLVQFRDPKDISGSLLPDAAHPLAPSEAIQDRVHCLIRYDSGYSQLMASTASQHLEWRPIPGIAPSDHSHLAD